MSLSANPGQGFTAQATLAPSTCAVGQQITFVLQSNLEVATTNLSGVASQFYFAPQTPGNYTIQASFAGAGLCGSSSGTGTLVVSGPTPTPTLSPGQPTPTPASTTALTVLNRTVMAGGPFSAVASLSPVSCAVGRTMNFNFGGLVKNAAFGLGGQAASPYTAPGNPGVYSLQASYAANGQCGASNGSASVTVMPSVSGTPTPFVFLTPTPTGFTPAPTPVPAPTPAPKSVKLSTSGLSFPGEAVNATSAPLFLSVANNNANAAVHITSISITPSNAIPGSNGRADFAESDNCVGALAPSSSCTITVAFTPGATGVQSATLQLHDELNSTPHGALVDPQKVLLSGSAVVPATASAKAMTFGRVKVKKPSTLRRLNITNHLKAKSLVLTITKGGTNAGEFVVRDSTNTCGNAVAPHKACHIDVVFQPTDTGPRAASLTITNDANADQISVSLSGTGK